MPEQINELAVYPIQLESIFVRELSIKSQAPPETLGDYKPPKYKIRTGLSPYDKANKIIGIALKLTVDGIPGATPEESPFELVVEVIGKFRVNEKIFPLGKLEDWAARNAPVILFPYVREQVYSLTQRAGYKPLLFPLVQVPTLELPQKRSSSGLKKGKDIAPKTTT